MQSMLIIPVEDWNNLRQEIRQMAELLSALQVAKPASTSAVASPYITAKEFMAAVRICRSNFDKLVQQNKIMTLKKGRKVYVVASEVDRYFREVQV
jgi:hypothetical protein